MGPWEQIHCSHTNHDFWQDSTLPEGKGIGKKERTQYSPLLQPEKLSSCYLNDIRKLFTPSFCLRLLPKKILSLIKWSFICLWCLKITKHLHMCYPIQVMHSFWNIESFICLEINEHTFWKSRFYKTNLFSETFHENVLQTLQKHHVIHTFQC